MAHNIKSEMSMNGHCILWSLAVVLSPYFYGISQKQNSI